MKRTFLLSAILLLTASAPALAGPPTKFIKQQVKAVRTLLGIKVAKGTPEAEAHDVKLKAIIDPLMEFDALSERALRKHWPTLKAEQRTHFTALFRELVFHSYLNKVRSANEDYSVVYEGEEPKPNKAAVVEAVAKTKKAEIELAFHLESRKGRTFVTTDIVIDEVSIVGNYREQFNKIIAEKGFDGLIAKMEKKLTKLGVKLPLTPAAAIPVPTK